MNRLTPALAAIAYGISPRTLHKWAREGRLTRHHDGFDIHELEAAEASRNMDALYSRAGIALKDRA